MGLYEIEQPRNSGVTVAFLRDLLNIQEQLNDVETALGLVSSANKTQFRATDGAARGDLTIPHMMVEHYVLGNTYLREVVNWTRLQGGAPAFGWVSVPAAATWGTRNQWEGLNLRWINELRQAIGRVSGGTQGLLKRWSGYADDGQVMQYQDSSSGVAYDFNSVMHYGNEADKSYPPYFVVPPESTTGYYLTRVDPDGVITVDRSAPPTFGQGWQSLRLSGFEVVPGSGGSAELVDFELAYPSKVIIHNIAGEAIPPEDGDEPGDIWSGSHRLQREAHVRGRRSVVIGGGVVTDNPPGIDSEEEELVNVTTPREEPIPFKWVSGNVRPTTATSIVQGLGSLNMEDKYFWIVPTRAFKYAFTDEDMLEPNLYSDFLPWANESVAANDAGFGGWAQVSYKASAAAAASGKASVVPGRFGALNSTQWIYWTEETLPMAEGWPNDEFTN